MSEHLPGEDIPADAGIAATKPVEPDPREPDATQPQAPLPGLPVLALLQAHERSGALAGSLRVTRWPILIGRGFSADLLLDDPHVAPSHLRVDRDAYGVVTVQVLETLNGVSQGGQTWRSGRQFVWKAGEELLLGRLKLGLRLADDPVPAELPMPHLPLRTTVGTAALAAGVVALIIGMAWLQQPESAVLAQRLPALLGAAVGSIAVWSGLWALVTRLFTGRLWFWRHVRIACATLLASQALETVAHLLAFMFSLESLARFDVLLNLVVGAVGVFAHLAVTAPQRRRGIAAIVAGMTLLTVTVLLSTSWLQTRRFSSQLYMATVFPPGWRLAPAVPVTQFLDEAKAIQKRLDQRLKDKDDEDAAAAEDEED